ncbi:MAG: hypothetical protein EOP49_48755 [Sphingobacteriales bacterium]|nr:MAG: hypothetical protein EOP49_48755 [Sphingobacteriales bacterium]
MVLFLCGFMHLFMKMRDES